LPPKKDKTGKVNMKKLQPGASGGREYFVGFRGGLWTRYLIVTLKKKLLASLAEGLRGKRLKPLNK